MGFVIISLRCVGMIGQRHLRSTQGSVYRYYVTPGHGVYTGEALIMTNKIPNIDGNFYRNLHKHYPKVDHAEGVYIWDTEGKKYLDGSGGACVVSIGHGVKEVRDAMMSQADRVSFTHGSHFTSEAAIEYAAELVSMMPSAALNKCYFLSESSTSVETAIKLYRQY